MNTYLNTQVNRSASRNCTSISPVRGLLSQANSVAGSRPSSRPGSSLSERSASRASSRCSEAPNVKYNKGEIVTLRSGVRKKYNGSLPLFVQCFVCVVPRCVSSYWTRYSLRINVKELTFLSFYLFVCLK